MTRVKLLCGSLLAPRLFLHVLIVDVQILSVKGACLLVVLPQLGLIEFVLVLDLSLHLLELINLLLKSSDLLCVLLGECLVVDLAYLI